MRVALIFPKSFSSVFFWLTRCGFVYCCLLHVNKTNKAFSHYKCKNVHLYTEWGSVIAGGHCRRTWRRMLVETCLWPTTFMTRWKQGQNLLYVLASWFQSWLELLVILATALVKRLESTIDKCGLYMSGLQWLQFKWCGQSTRKNQERMNVLLLFEAILSSSTFVFYPVWSRGDKNEENECMSLMWGY